MFTLVLIICRTTPNNHSTQVSLIEMPTQWLLNIGHLMEDSLCWCVLLSSSGDGKGFQRDIRPAVCSQAEDTGTQAGTCLKEWGSWWETQFKPQISGTYFLTAQLHDLCDLQCLHLCANWGLALLKTLRAEGEVIQWVRLREDQNSGRSHPNDNKTKIWAWLCVPMTPALENEDKKTRREQGKSTSQPKGTWSLQV